MEVSISEFNLTMTKYFLLQNVAEKKRKRDIQTCVELHVVMERFIWKAIYKNKHQNKRNSAIDKIQKYHNIKTKDLVLQC